MENNDPLMKLVNSFAKECGDFEIRTMPAQNNISTGKWELDDAGCFQRGKLTVALTNEVGALTQLGIMNNLIIDLALKGNKILALAPESLKLREELKCTIGKRGIDVDDLINICEYSDYCEIYSVGFDVEYYIDSCRRVFGDADYDIIYLPNLERYTHRLDGRAQADSLYGLYDYAYENSKCVVTTLCDVREWGGRRGFFVNHMEIGIENLIDIIHDSPTIELTNGDSNDRVTLSIYSFDDDMYHIINVKSDDSFVTFNIADSYITGLDFDEDDLIE